MGLVARGLHAFDEPPRKTLIVGEAAPELRTRACGACCVSRDCEITTGWFLGAAVRGALETIGLGWFGSNKVTVTGRA